MRRHLAPLVLVLLACWAPRGTRADEKEKPASPADSISAEKIREHIAFLASDELEGRDSGEPGLEVAAEYIANRFREMGLEPAGDDGTFFQHFTVPFGAEFGRIAGARIVDSKGVETKWEPGTQVVPLAHGEGGPVDAPLVFAGYGITTGDEERKEGLVYDDYSGIDVQGKALIVLRFVPRDQEKNPFGGRKSPHAALLAKIRNARRHGAAAVIFVTPPKGGPADAAGENDLHGIAHRASPRPPTLPALVAHPRAVSDVLALAGKDLQALAREIDERLSPKSFELPGLRVRLDTRPGQFLLRNVVARLKGSQSSPGKETLLIGAHYDHIGRFGNQVSLKYLGQIHNGADDNASGVAGVLELARVLSRGGSSSGRAILFACFSGEEIGLLGSRAWVNAPRRPEALEPVSGPEPADRIVAMINLDMIGRAKAGAPVTALGAGSSPAFSDLLRELSKKDGVPLQISGGEFAGADSDHASFLRRNIPILFFFTGMHPQYNTPDDDTATINFEGERWLLELVRDCAVAIASAPERPRFNPQFVAKAPSGHGKPKLGIEIDTDHESGGVRVRSTIPDTPAAKAGVKEGDVIVALGETEVQKAENLLSALEAIEDEEELPLKIRRGEKEEVLKVLFPARRGGFKVSFGSVPDYAFSEKGVRFEDIRQGSPAEKAGVKAGDVLVRWNDKEIEDVEHWTEILGAHKPGDEVAIQVRRGESRLELKVKLEARE
jgi:hypothetical protein